MKKYLLTFICTFCVSALFSTFYVLISHNNSIHSSDNSITGKNLIENVPSKDFTQAEIETIENNLIKQPLEFIMPVNSNQIGLKFSNEQLIYSKTLNEWILHNGTDIVVPIGSNVCASEKGKIIEISSNVGDGIKIVIEHEDGYKTVYSNLSTTKMVQEGQTVEKGTVISTVGKTATFEYEEKDHLHFEIYKDNEPVNPLNLVNS